MRQADVNQEQRLAAIHARVIASMRQDRDMVASRREATMPFPNPGKNAKALKKASYQLNEAEEEIYCCAITCEIMDDPVIDPTTLMPAIDPNTDKPFVNPTGSEQFINYNDVPRYERKSLENLIESDGAGKSPNTRLIFTAAQLVPDTELRSKLDMLAKRELEKYEGLVTHRVFGELYFKLEKSTSGLEPYRMCIILQGREINGTGMLIGEKPFQFLSKNCDIRSIFDLENFFSDGHTSRIIKGVIEDYRRSLTHHVVGDLSFMIEPSSIKDGFIKQRISIIKNRRHLIAITFDNTDTAECILSANGNIEQLKINLARISTFVAWIENTEAEVRQNQAPASRINRNLYHIVGDLYFKIEEYTAKGPTDETHCVSIIIHENGAEVLKTGINLKQDKVEKILQNIENLSELKNIFTTVIRGVTALTILNLIVDAEKRAARPGNSSSPSGMFGAFQQVQAAQSARSRTMRPDRKAERQTYENTI